MMFDHILIAVDGSESATDAASHAIALASRFDAAVDVVHVVEEPAQRRRGATTSAHQRGRELIESVTQAGSAAGVTVDTYLLEGRPYSTIVEHAGDRDVDLIVMGRHGRSGVGERLVGTVTERVLRNVDTPVLTVGSSSSATAYETVLVPTDGSEGAERALPYGEAVAARYGAMLHGVSVADVQAAAGVFDAGGVSQEFVDGVVGEGEAAVDSLVDGVSMDVAVEQSVVRGVPHEEIGEYVVATDVDIVVMGSSGASSFAGQSLGSVANRVLRTVAVPVLLV